MFYKLKYQNECQLLACKPVFKAVDAKRFLLSVNKVLLGLAWIRLFILCNVR